MDLIDRQAAIDEIEETIKANSSIHYEMRYWEDGMNCAKNILEDLPSAQKTGTWVDHQEGKWIYAQCNTCGTIWDTKSNYCPNCGAKMEDEQDG